MLQLLRLAAAASTSDVLISCVKQRVRYLAIVCLFNTVDIQIVILRLRATE